MPDPLSKLEKILQHADDDFIQKEEFKELIDLTITIFQEMRTRLIDEMALYKKDTISSALSNVSVIEERMNDLLSSKCSVKDMKDAINGVLSELSMLKETMPIMPDLSVLEAKIAQVEASLKKVTPSMDEKIDNLYNELKKYVDSRPKTEVQTRSIIGGRIGVQIFNNGNKVDTKVNEIDFRDGLTVYMSNGRLTVISSAAKITSTGSIDGSNTVFVFTTAPNVIVVDNIAKQRISSDGSVNWTITGTTVTLTIAPNFDIFGL